MNIYARLCCMWMWMNVAQDFPVANSCWQTHQLPKIAFVKCAEGEGEKGREGELKEWVSLIPKAPTACCVGSNFINTFIILCHTQWHKWRLPSALPLPLPQSVAILDGNQSATAAAAAAAAKAVGLVSHLPPTSTTAVAILFGGSILIL